MKIYLQCRDEANKEYQRLRRMRWTGWQFLLYGCWAADPYIEAKKSVWFSQTADRHVWAILEAASRRKIVAVCVCDPGGSTEEVVAAMMCELDKGSCGRYDAPERYGTIDFDRFWLLYRGRHFHEQSASREPSASGEREEPRPERRMENVVPFHKPPPGEKFDPEEALSTFRYVQWKRKNREGMEAASKLKREEKAKRRKSTTRTKK
jgi:hypothetical protein